MRSVIAGMMVAGVIAGAAVAQESDALRDISDILATDDEEQAPDVAVDNAAPGANEPLSELDRLSRSAGDDPFAGVLASQKREPVSVTLRALDKITARYTDLTISMNELAHFGSLEIVPRTCDKRPPEEFPETTAFLEISDIELTKQVSNLRPRETQTVEDEIDVAEISELEVAPVTGSFPQAGDAAAAAPGAVVEPSDAARAAALAAVEDGPVTEGVSIFKGWMFASSPALNPLEHGVYDVWVIDCETRVASN